MAAALVAAAAGLAACAGEPGPMGPQGPPGEPVRGASYVAHFDRLDDLQTWEFGPTGDWRVDDGRLVLTAAAGERAIAGPGARFSGDLDVSVEATWLRAGEGSSLGLRFHAGVAGAYVLAVSRDGMFALIREDAAGAGEPVIPWTPSVRLGGEAGTEVRAVVRGAGISVYVGGTLVARTADVGPRQGGVQVFVAGPATAAFDEMWVNRALPLR